MRPPPNRPELLSLLGLCSGQRYDPYELNIQLWQGSTSFWLLRDSEVTVASNAWRGKG